MSFQRALNTPMPEVRRTRRLTRRRIVGVVVAIIGLWLAWQVYDIFTGKPDPKVDYATPLFELIARDQPEGESGWDLYTRTIDHIGQVSTDAFDAAHKAIEEQREAMQDAAIGEAGPAGEPAIDPLYFPSFEDITHASFDPSAWTVHLDILASLEADGSLHDLTRLCAMQRFVPPIDASLTAEEINKLGPKLGHFRTTAKLNAARMRLAAHDGRWDDFARITDESLFLSRVMSNQSTIMRQLIAGSVAAVTINEVRNSSIEFQPPESACLRLRDILEARLPLPAVTRHLEGDRLYSLDSLQRTYTASGRLPVSQWGKHRGGTFWGEEEVGPVKGGIADALAIAVPGHDTAAQWINEFFDEAIVFAQRPLPERLRLRFAPSRSADNLPINQIILREYGFGYLDRFIASDAVMECEGQSAALMLLVEAYRARHGAPPAALADLVPAYLESLPLDPASGQNYGYRLLTDDPHGRPYLLYSFGVDGADDGGVEEWIMDWYNPEKSGADHVINRPRAEK